MHPRPCIIPAALLADRLADRLADGLAVPPAARRTGRAIVACALGLVVAALVAACGGSVPSPKPPIVAGTAASPREVNLIMKDYSFLPAVLDLVPGETVLLHVINGGLEVHDAIIGAAAVQDAWAAAEAAVAGAPPGPTPAVSVPPGLEGLRIVARSGERVDVTWMVPDAPGPGASPIPLVVGCHIPGHWEKGMQIPVRFVQPGDATAPSS